MRFGIVFAVAGLPLLEKRSAFWLDGKPLFDVLRDVAETRERRPSFSRDTLIRCVSALPDAREVGLAI